MELNFKNKLIEEAAEVKDEDTQKGIMTELADVLEVVDGLCKAYEIDKEELMQVKEEKRYKRGGFEAGFYVEYVEMSEDNVKVKHFRSSPEKYPED